jgi:hypothetical protein
VPDDDIEAELWEIDEKPLPGRAEAADRARCRADHHRRLVDGAELVAHRSPLSLA